MAWTRRRRARPARRSVKRRRVSYRRKPRRMTRRSRLKRYKLRQRMAIGVSRRDMNKTQSTILAETTSNFRNTFPIASLSLYGVDCTTIDKMSSAFERSDRMFQQVDFRGIKYNFIIRNASSHPVVFNYGVVSFKNNNYTLEQTTWPAEPLQSPTLAADGWFRWNGDSRDENFDNGISSITIGYNPISSDQYNVHMHKRTILGPKYGSADWSGNRESYKHITGYVPIKRILRFNDDASEKCENPIWIVYWVTRLFENSGNPRFLNLCEIMQCHTSYFTQVC